MLRFGLLWKSLVLAAVILVIFLAALLLMGPLFPVSPGPSDISQKVAAALSVEAYLHESESRVSGLKPEAAKGIVWADPKTSARTPLSIIYLHGFSASRHEMTPVIENLAREMGANVFFNRMRAHGLQDGEGFATVTAEDWIEDAREAMAIARRIGDRVLIVGMSFGAVLATHLALENAEAKDLAGLILVSPNFKPAAKGVSFVSGPFGPWIARLVIGRERRFEVVNDLHEKYWTSRYRSEGVAAMMDVCNYIARQDLGRVKVPLLVLYTKLDKVVDVGLIVKRFEEFGSARKTLVDLPEADRHEFASDAISPKAVEPTLSAMSSFARSLN